MNVGGNSTKKIGNWMKGSEWRKRENDVLVAVSADGTCPLLFGFSREIFLFSDFCLWFFFCLGRR